MNPVWDIERRLWLEGAEAYETVMAAQCLIAFGPMGVMSGQDIVESLRDAPRWSDVQMSARQLIEPADGLVVIAYEAEARRPDAEPYRALCTSSYSRQDGAFKIVQHQQTPL